MWGALEKEGPGEELEDLRRRYEPVCLKYWPRWTSQSLQGTLLPDLMSQAHPAATVGPLLVIRIWAVVLEDDRTRMDQKFGMQTAVYPSIYNTFHTSEIQRRSQRRIWPIIWYEAHIKNIPQTCKLSDNSIAEWSIILFKIWAKGRKHRNFSGTVRGASRGIIVTWCTSDRLLLTSECCSCLAGHVCSDPCIHF